MDPRACFLTSSFSSIFANLFWNKTILSLIWCKQFYFYYSSLRTSSLISRCAWIFFNFLASCLLVIWVLFILKEDSVLFGLRNNWTSAVLNLFKLRLSVRKNFLGKLDFFFVNRGEVLLLNYSYSGVVKPEVSILKDFSKSCPYSLSYIKAFRLAILASEQMCPYNSLIFDCFC